MSLTQKNGQSRPHRHARTMLAKLFEKYKVIVVTARPSEATERTRRWLLRHRLAFDEFENAKQALKSEHDLDALVDDFPGNISQYLQETNGVAILVDRPWNRKRESLASWPESRLAIVEDLAAVPRTIARLLASDPGTSTS